MAEVRARVKLLHWFPHPLGAQRHGGLAAVEAMFPTWLEYGTPLRGAHCGKASLRKSMAH